MRRLCSCKRELWQDYVMKEASIAERRSACSLWPSSPSSQPPSAPVQLRPKAQPAVAEPASDNVVEAKRAQAQRITPVCACGSTTGRQHCCPINGYPCDDFCRGLKRESICSSPHRRRDRMGC